MKTIIFDYQTFSQLKKDYRNAVENKKETFLFQGTELLTEYAKFIIEYLTSRMN